MSISERVEQIIAEKNRAASQARQVLRDDELTEVDKRILLRCVNAIYIYGITESLEEIHQKTLGGKGEVSEDAYLEVGKDRMVMAEATISWQVENTDEPSRISVSVKKSVGSSRPFELVIESSEDLRFTTSIDTPEADAITRDGDIGRWDIRSIQDLDENLGFFSTPDSLRKGIEERLAIASAQLLTNK